MMRGEEAKALFIKHREDESLVLSIEQCQQLDQYIKHYALGRLQATLQDNPLANFVLTMARCHFGSTEVDDILMSLNCYPEWMG